MSDSKKKSYIQIMRIIACLLVLYNHTYSFYQFGLTSGWKQLVFMFLTIITKINVPIFLMITGALLLGKDEEWGTVFRKRFIRFLLCLLLFEFILYILSSIQDARVNGHFILSIPMFIRMFLQNTLPGAFPYWYMYSLLGLLLVLPFIQRIAKGITHKEFWAILVLHFIFYSLFPIINLILLKNGQEPISICQDFAVPFAFEKIWFYPLVGYYIDKHIDIKRLSVCKTLCLMAVASAGIAVSAVCTFIEATIIGDYTQNYIEIFSYIIAIACFLLVKRVCMCLDKDTNEHGKCISLINTIGTLTLGIYMFDPCLKCVIYHLYEIKMNTVFNVNVNTFSGSVSWIVISFILGGLLTFLIKKTPLVNKLL